MDPVEEIKGRLAIEDLVGRYVDLKRSGASYKGLCPFHNEKTPSFYVSPSRGSYHCFGCGNGGDVFSFVMEAERLTFPEALKQLAGQTGVDLPERETAQPSLKGRLYEANETAATFFADTLGSAAGERARAYLAERGFGATAAELFSLGYTPEGRERLVQHLHAAGFDDRILLAAGLALQDDVGGKARDRFRGRLMFPIRDRSGRVTGFGGRTLGDVQPKYLNSPQTEIFDKSATLFAIHLAQDAIRQSGQAVVVEGYLDAIRAHTAGFLDTVASLGTAITTQQLIALSRLTDRVILALDPDAAGQAAAARTSITALAELRRTRTSGAGNFELRIARLPADHGDPDELIRDHADLWQESIASAIPAFDFYFEQSMRALDRSSDAWRQEAIDRLLPVIQQFAGAAGWQAVWLERLAHETGIDPRALQRSLGGGAAPAQRRPVRSKDDGQRSVVSGTTARALGSDPLALIERALVGLLLQLIIIPDEAATLLRDVSLHHPGHRALLSHLLAWQDNRNYDYEMFRETLPDDLQRQADELRTLDVPLPDDGKISVAVASHLARLRRFQLEVQLSRATDLLPELAAEDRPPAVANLAELMRQRYQVERELDQLSQRALQSISHAPDHGTMDQDSGRL